MARKTYSDLEKEQVREALVNAAIQCIVDRGLVHCSIDTLCRKTGISKTFFYTLFPSKEDLVVQALCCQQPKLLRYARKLMDDPCLSWREGVRTFLKDCCCGAKGIAVLSIEEEQDIYRCLSPEKFQAFREKQLRLFRDLMTVFGLPAGSIDPRLLGNLTLSMIMVYKAIPDTMPFLFPERAEETAEFQISALLDMMEQARKRQPDEEKEAEKETEQK